MRSHRKNTSHLAIQKILYLHLIPLSSLGKLGNKSCSGCWGVREGCRDDLPLHIAAPGFCRVWRSAWSVGQTRGQTPAGAPVASLCHRERVPVGALRRGCSSNTHGCSQSPDSFLLCQEKNIPPTLQSSLPILFSLSSSFSLYICSMKHFQDLHVRLFSVRASK